MCLLESGMNCNLFTWACSHEMESNDIKTTQYTIINRAQKSVWGRHLFVRVKCPLRLSLFVMLPVILLTIMTLVSSTSAWTRDRASASRGFYSTHKNSSTRDQDSMKKNNWHLISIPCHLKTSNHDPDHIGLHIQ